MALIEDGSGTGYSAKVNKNQRLYTNSVSIGETRQANKKGNAYNVNTGLITLTDAVDTPVMYMKNNEDQNIHITAIAVGFFPSTGGVSTETPYVTVIRNPTAGTIISNATDVDINSNRNYGSQNTLTVDAYKGATGNTMTDGEDHLLLQASEPSRLFAAIDEVLEKGSTVGIKIKPQTSNTSMQVYAAIICHLEDINE